MEEQSNSKGFAILTIAALMVKFLSLIYTPVLFNILGGNKQLSIYSAAYQVYTFVYVLTSAGIPSAISKLVSEFAAVENYRSALKIFKISRMIVVISGIVMAIITFLFSAPFTKLLGYPEARYAVMALCPAILFTCISSSYRGYFQGRGNMKPTAITQVVEQILNTVFSLIFGALLIGYGIKYGCAGATVGTTLGALVSAIYLIITYQKNKKSERIDIKKSSNQIIHTNQQILNRILKYSVPITLCVGINSLGSLIDTSNMINRLQAGGLHHDYAQSLCGIYSKFSTLTGVPISIISALAVTVLPSLSKTVAVSNTRLVESKINFAFKLSLLISIPAAFGLSVLSKPIYGFLKFRDGYDVLMMGAVVVILMALLQIQTIILQGVGRIYIITVYSIIGIAIKFITNYVLIAIRGINIYGAIIGTLIGLIVPVILSAIYIRKNLNVKIQFKPYIYKLLMSTLVMGSVGYGVYTLLNSIIGLFTKSYIDTAIPLLAAIAAGIYVYFYILALSKGITKDEYELTPVRLRKFVPRRVVYILNS